MAAKRGRVARVQLGRGPELWTGRRGDTRLVLAALPFGGRIEYEGVHRPSALAVVAISGPAANLLLGFGLLTLGAALADPMPAGPLPGGPVGAAAGATGWWFWLVPRALGHLLLEGDASPLREAGRTLLGLAAGRGAGFAGLAGAVSAVWAAVNLLPVPVIRTDGWHVLRAGWRAVRGEGKE